MEKYRFTAIQRMLMENSRIPFAVYQFLDKRVVTIALSEGFCDLFGYTDRAEAYYDMDYDMYCGTHPDDVARIADIALQFATKGGRYEAVYRSRKRGESVYHIIHAIGEHVYTDTKERLAYVWYTDEGVYDDSQSDSPEAELNRSISNALHEESILRANYYDYLTGLPSMTYFFELAETGRDAILKDGGEPALLFIDLGGMKFYNRRHGFAEGDRLLREFAHLLTQCFSTESCSRIGQDHFAVVTRAEGLEDTLRKLFQDARELNERRSLPIHVGIYLNSMESVGGSTACDRAKFACDALRNTYMSGFNYYDQSLRDVEERQRYIIENIDRALEEKWVKVYYQPIVRAVNGRVCDEEALARWIDPERGLLPPEEFVPYLEEARLIYKLDLYVADQIIEKMQIQMKAGLHLVPQSINLSRSDFEACDIVEEIRRRVDDAGIGRDKLTIEITESMIGADFDFMKSQVDRFHKLGFRVWMDDFGSGYSSLDVLQSIPFDLIKFDMRFMQDLNKGESGRIILTELMKMATALGVDAVCEGVETEEQVRFLREIGCSKLQGHNFCKAIPLEEILERYRRGLQIGFENPEESAYYEAIGKANLYDLAVITGDDPNSFHNFFNTLPMAIVELRGEKVHFVRSSQSFRKFVKDRFGVDLYGASIDYAAPLEETGTAFINMVRQCCRSDSRAFVDEKLPDGTTIHAFARRLVVNPISGTIAVALAVLSVMEANEGTTYANIARALAADYFNLYYVDLETEHFIEYSSNAGGEDLSLERHGEDFFNASRHDAPKYLYPEDREKFVAAFTKENILREFREQGIFTLTYRLLADGEPQYVNMKATRMDADGKYIIIGVSNVDSQMRQKAALERIEREQLTYSRIMALAGSYICLYTVDIATEHYIEFSATKDYEGLGLAKEGEDFFTQARVNAERAIHPDDLPEYLRRFSREDIFDDIRKTGTYRLRYRLMIDGTAMPVSLHAALVDESDGQKLIIGVKRLVDRAGDR